MSSASDFNIDLAELLKDADGHRLLTQRDEDFLAGFRNRAERYGVDSVFVSEGQAKWLKDIEAKIYA